ncbi:SIR2 family protein [Thermodesulfobacteriota bacterium B35]
MSTEIAISLTSEVLKKFLRSTWSENFEKSLFIAKRKQQTHKQKLETITDWYRSQRLVMVLGAGSSASYGLPDWNTLLQKLLLISIKTDDDEDTKNTAEKAGVLARTFTGIFEPNALISARYLHNYFKKKNPNSKLAFENSIRDALYAGLKSKEDSELLKEIRQFCIAAGRSPNLDSIITYNYDDLIEQCLKNIDVDIPFSPIYSRGMKHERHELPIYHVHGYLPQKGQLTAKNRVVLSEEGYHQQYTEVYGWSNLTQINKFKDYNCLFIGVSFSDPNLRRLLDISKNERGDDEIHHYCFKKRHDNSDVKDKLEKLLYKNNNILDEKTKAQMKLNELVSKLIKLMEKFEENDALSFGVGIVWVDSYDEIPESLKKIRLGV